MTSARPARSSRGGSVASVPVSANTRRGWWNAPIRFLPPRMVDAGLAADRGVDLREQRRRHLHEVDAALVAGGGEAGHVADDAAAERDDAGVAVEAGGDQRVEDARDVAERLVLLAVGQRAASCTRVPARPAASARRYSGADGRRW